MSGKLTINELPEITDVNINDCFFPVVWNGKSYKINPANMAKAMLNSIFPIEYEYFTTDPNFNANINFGGTWTLAIYSAGYFFFIDVTLYCWTRTA